MQQLLANSNNMAQLNRRMNVNMNVQTDQGAQQPSQPQPSTQEHPHIQHRIQRIGPTTRLQFMLPGEQFDLYGFLDLIY